jgi:hypothetical protein
MCAHFAPQNVRFQLQIDMAGRPKISNLMSVLNVQQIEGDVRANWQHMFSILFQSVLIKHAIYLNI